MNNNYKCVIHAIENGLNYVNGVAKVVPVYANVNDKVPSFFYIKSKHNVITLVKRQNYIYIVAEQGTNVRLVNVILKHFTHGEYKIFKRGGNYFLKCFSEAPIWFAELN